MSFGSFSLREPPAILNSLPTANWLRHTVIGGLVCLTLVSFSMAFIDRPVELWVYSHMQFWWFFKIMASPSLLSLPLSYIYLLVYAFGRLAGRVEGAFTPLFLPICVATIVATAAKDELKWLFGRPWPQTWVQYGIYNFHSFVDNNLFGCFPSGHTTYIAAPMFVLWWRLPKYRLLWIAIIFMVMIGLVGSGYHFVGDVIFGFFLGLAAATGTVAVWPRLPVPAVGC